MPINSRTKGKRGELEFSSWIHAHWGVDARRSVQFCGRAGDADLITPLPVHFEVKREERLAIYKTVHQCLDDARGTGRVPVVAWRKNKEDWLLIVEARNMLTFAEILVNRHDFAHERGT
jgi:hypothetical protein